MSFFFKLLFCPRYAIVIHKNMLVLPITLFFPHFVPFLWETKVKQIPFLSSSLILSSTLKLPSKFKPFPLSFSSPCRRREDWPFFIFVFLVFNIFFPIYLKFIIFYSCFLSFFYENFFSFFESKFIVLNLLKSNLL